MTLPFGTVALACCVAFANRSPAAWIAACA